MSHLSADHLNEFVGQLQYANRILWGVWQSLAGSRGGLRAHHKALRMLEAVRSDIALIQSELEEPNTPCPTCGALCHDDSDGAP